MITRKYHTRNKSRNNNGFLKNKSENSNYDNKSVDSLNTSSNVSKKIEEVLYKHKKITKLYDWQLQCLKIAGIGKNRNLVYSLPTSGGKTLVAEILMLRQLTIKRKSVIFILPFISLVQEKVKALSPFGLDLKFLVEEYAGGKGKFPPTKHRKYPSVYVATIEKAHLLINSFIETKQTDKIGLLVVDELHMVGDGSKRGANLELCLLKFIKMFQNTPIVGMSATLDNMDEICRFLNAELFISDFRPVKLVEYTKVNTSIHEIKSTAKNVKLEQKFKPVRTMGSQLNSAGQRRDPDNVIGLVSEILPDKSCLIFCATKKQCENLANNIISLASKELLSPPEKVVKREHLINILKEECLSVCPILKSCIMMGIAYHHSDLTQEERKVVEEGFIDGSISVICCTSTLAAGVNLPARRVIIRSPYVGRNFITYSQYKQMTGRAGRAGFDTEGDSFVILAEKDKEKFGNLMLESCSRCSSSLLVDDGRMVKYFVLSLVSLEMIQTIDDILEMLAGSLFNIQNPGAIQDVLVKVVQFLVDHNLIKQVKNPDSDLFVLKSTEIGRAVVRGSLDVHRAEDIYNDLKVAETSLNTSTYLHMLYLVSPPDIIDVISIDWNIYHQRVCHLSDKEMTFFQSFGMDKLYFMRKPMDHIEKTDTYKDRRLYLTLILYDLWNQQPTHAVAKYYNQSGGQIQSLLQSAVTLSACLSNFVDEFQSDLWAFKMLFPNFTVQLSYCVAPELIPLMEIDGVKKGRARILFKAGFDSVSKIASSDFKSISSALQPISTRVVNQIISSAQMIIQHRLQSLAEEVQDLIVINNKENDPQGLRSFAEEVQDLIVINNKNNEQQELRLLMQSTPKRRRVSQSFNTNESSLFNECDSNFFDS